MKNKKEIKQLLKEKDELKKKKPTIDNSEKLQKNWLKKNKIKKA